MSKEIANSSDEKIAEAELQYNKFSGGVPSLPACLTTPDRATCTNAAQTDANKSKRLTSLDKKIQVIPLSKNAVGKHAKSDVVPPSSSREKSSQSHYYSPGVTKSPPPPKGKPLPSDVIVPKKNPKASDVSFPSPRSVDLATGLKYNHVFMSRVVDTALKHKDCAPKILRLRNEIARLRSSKEVLIRERDTAVGHKDSIIKEKNDAIEARDFAVKEKNDAIAEKDKLLVECEEAKKSVKELTANVLECKAGLVRYEEAYELLKRNYDTVVGILEASKKTANPDGENADAIDNQGITNAVDDVSERQENPLSVPPVNTDDAIQEAKEVGS